MTVEADDHRPDYPWGQPMAGKKQTDATGNLPKDHPTQVGPGGTKLGLPKREEVMNLLHRLSGKKQS